MRLMIDKNWELMANSAGWTLTEKYTGKNKKDEVTEYENNSYHGNIGAALMYYLDNQLKASSDIKDLFKRYDTLERTVTEATKNIPWRKKDELDPDAGDQEAGDKHAGDAEGLAKPAQVPVEKGKSVGHNRRRGKA